MPNSRQPVLSSTRAKTRNGRVLVIISWGSVAWYWMILPEVTIGGVRHNLAKKVGRFFDGVVVGLELLITGTDIVPSLLTPLSALTYPPYRNVCLDVASSVPSSQSSSPDSVGERLLRKHLCNERFQAGVDQRLWRLIQLRWPHAVFGISTRFDNGEIALRLNLEKYPTARPLVESWDLETQTAVEPEHWPATFIKLATAVYPEIADLSPGPYCLNLLRVSTAVASRQQKAKQPEWEVTQDLTQLLSRVSGCFR
jgi:hypothetical protein